MKYDGEWINRNQSHGELKRSFGKLFQCSVKLIACEAKLIRSSLKLIECERKLIQSSAKLIECVIGLIECKTKLIRSSVKLTECEVNLIQSRRIGFSCLEQPNKSSASRRYHYLCKTNRLAKGSCKKG